MFAMHEAGMGETHQDEAGDVFAADIQLGGQNSQAEVVHEERKEGNHRDGYGGVEALQGIGRLGPPRSPIIPVEHVENGATCSPLSFSL